MTQLWEYKVIELPPPDEDVLHDRSPNLGQKSPDHSLQITLNALGAQGWELLHYQSVPYPREGFKGPWGIFKRAILSR